MNQISLITIDLDGVKTKIECHEGETILDAALRNNLNVPYACLSGTCNSCQAHLDAGQVKMECQDALTDEEVAQGEILTCQAKPLTSEVKITYP